MELNNSEVFSVEPVADQVQPGELKQLGDLQLVLVGGGIGDTIL